MQPDSQVPTIIFLHILKTAGTTFNRLLAHYYPAARVTATFPNIFDAEGSIEKFEALSEAEKGRIALLTGHMGFGLHEQLPQPATYVTILRDPVERVVSRYYHEQRDVDSELHSAIQKGMDLKEYALYYANVGAMDNLQVRMISGNWRLGGFGSCDEAMLALAKRNLAEHFLLAGLTEQFDAFYVLMARLMGWKKIPYQRRNVTRNRPVVETIPPDTLATLRQLDAYDIALYQHVAQQFSDRVAALGVGFALELPWYKTYNWVHEQIADVELIHKLYEQTVGRLRAG